MENINHTTQKPYREGNQLTLEAVRADKGYKSCEWATFHQFISVGRVVKTGEHGVKIKTPPMEMWDVTEDEKASLKFANRTFTVFNLEQTEELPPK